MPIKGSGVGRDTLGAFREREAWVRQVEENSARLAASSVSIVTTGWGEKAIRKVVDFGCTFIEQPTVQHGYALSDDEDDDEILIDGRWPRAMGFVREWQHFEQNGIRYYTGAYVAVIVDTIGPTQVTPDPFNDPNYTIEHSFIFTGIAIKDIMASIEPPK